jgi:uncharacterized membrane protein
MIKNRLYAFVFSPWFVLLVAFLLRIVLIGRESYWLDEVLTINDSLKPIPDIVGQRWDPHPPLYYLLLHFWLKAGQTEVIARFPSAVFGTLSVLFVYLIGLRLTKNQRLAWLMAMLLAVAPIHIWYSQETRMYALVAMLALASTWLWLLLLQEGYRHIWLWLAYIVTTSLGLYTHYTMPLIVIGQNLYVIAAWSSRPEKRQERPLRYWLISQLILVLLYVPWLPQLPKHWLVFQQIPPYSALAAYTTPALVGVIGCMLLLLVALSVWMRKGFLIPKPVERLGVTAVSLVTLVLYLFMLYLTVSSRMTTLQRQSFVLFPFLCMVLIYTLAQPGKKWQYGFLALLGISFIVTCLNYALLQKPAWREVVAFIETNVESSEAIAFNPRWANAAFDYYHERNASPVTANIEVAAPLSTQYPAVWLITDTKAEKWADPNQETRNWFISQYELESHYQFGELEILHFQLPAP